MTAFFVHGDRTLGAGFQTFIENRLAAILRGHHARIERVAVRFEDLNGPKGGDDTACRIQVTIAGQQPLVVEARAEGEEHAFRLAVPKLTAALNRQLERRRERPRATLREMTG
ncbi:MAG: HPF/RaiA family ribosome-associated protein [Myxococcota bacterium]|nr:HPF/RaiA family ribosome-associated protein [Myxococcota bacterium]